MREKLMKLDRRTDRLGRGEVVVDPRPLPVIVDQRPVNRRNRIIWFTRYLWRGSVTGKLYCHDVCDAHMVSAARRCGLHV